MSRVCTCRSCGLSFNATHAMWRRPAWCDQCRDTPRQVPASAYVAVRLATYSAASRLAICHIQRHEYAQATAVLTAAQDAA